MKISLLKHHIIYFSFILFLCNTSLAQEKAQQEKFILKTAQPNKLRIVENGWNNKIPTWRKAGKGYLLIYDDAKKIDIKAVTRDTSDLAIFQLFRLADGAETTVISLRNGQRISLHNCLRAYKRPQNTQIWQNLWEKVKGFISKPLGALSTGRPSLFREMPRPLIDYQTANHPVFLTPDAVSIRWKNTAGRGQIRVTLRNLDTKKVSVQQQTDNFFPNASFPKQHLIAGNKYVLGVEVEGVQGHSEINFSILSKKELELLESFLAQ